MNNFIYFHPGASNMLTLAQGRCNWSFPLSLWWKQTKIQLHSIFSTCDNIENSINATCLLFYLVFSGLVQFTFNTSLHRDLYHKDICYVDIPSLSSFSWCWLINYRNKFYPRQRFKEGFKLSTSVPSIYIILCNWVYFKFKIILMTVFDIFSSQLHAKIFQKIF